MPAVVADPCNAGRIEMTLVETVQQLEKLDGNVTIYARIPWTPSTEARLAVEGSEEARMIRADGLSYFLEVLIARDFVEGWLVIQRRRPTGNQCCARLIEYATNDA